MRHNVSNADAAELTEFLAFVSTITATVLGVAEDEVITRVPSRAAFGAK